MKVVPWAALWSKNFVESRRLDDEAWGELCRAIILRGPKADAAFKRYVQLKIEAVLLLQPNLKMKTPRRARGRAGRGRKR